MSWTERYRPKKFLDVKGQDLAIAGIKKYLSDFNLGNLTRKAKKALVMHGGPGVGKTTLAHVVALETNSEIFELNASDLRNKSKLQEILKPVLEQKSLFNERRKIILIDEVDGVSGTKDRGGITELLRLIEISPYPILITANDIWKSKLSGLRKKVELIQLKDLDYKLMKEVLIDILRKEGKFVDSDILTRICVKAKGDLRAAVNDLQTIASFAGTSKEEIKIEDERNKELDIFNALRFVFKARPNEETLRIFDSVKMPIDEIMLWVEENMPQEYSGLELAKGYHALSNSDLFKGRIYKKQYWRFLVYQYAFSSYGVAAAKQDVKSGFTGYKRPGRILKIWLNNQRNAKRKTIAEKYAKKTHIGVKRVMHDFPVLINIVKKKEVQKELKLNEDEIAYLNKY